jgi:hypothetical protein
VRLTVQRVWDMTLVVSAIIRDRRAMPQRGKYHLARLHAKLLPEFTLAAGRRDELIAVYQHKAEGESVWSVPADRLEDYVAAWKEIAGIEIDVDVQPFALADLDLPGLNGAIEAAEIVILGDLVMDSSIP